MRVKNHQKRANVAFTKALTTHLMRGKGDFSCRGPDPLATRVESTRVGTSRDDPVEW